MRAWCWAIYAVATHKTAYEVADELLHDNGIVPDDFSVFDINLAFLQDGDFIQGHIGSELVLQAVDVDELTVEFFFVLMKLKELGGPLHLIEVHTPLQTLGGRSCGVYADACGAGIVIENVYAGSLVDGEQLVGLEIPGGFVGVPVLFGDGDVLSRKQFYIFWSTITSRHFTYFSNLNMPSRRNNFSNFPEYLGILPCYFFM